MLRYASGLLHLVLLGSNLVLVGAGWLYVLALLGQLALARRIRRTRPDRAVLRARHLGDRSGPVELRQARRSRRLGPSGHAMNRAADVALAGVGLALTSPLLAAAALAIKLEDGGPVLFRQNRVGKDGEGLRARQAPLDGRRARSTWARATPSTAATRASPGSAGSSAGRRSTSCRSSGTSSAATCRVIGPRPTLRYQVDRYSARQRRRLDVRPGLTGWAQVNGRATLRGTTASSSTCGTSSTARRSST